MKPSNSLTNAEYKKIIKKKKRSKWGNVRTTYNGVVYDSTAEAKYAAKLDLLKRAGEVIEITRQVPFKIEVNNVYIAYYKLDFLVKYNNGSLEYIDVKAFDKKKGEYISTTEFKLKKKLVEAIYSIKIKLASVK